MSEEIDAVSVADTAISVAAHLEDELEEALADHRLSRGSFLVLDALARAQDGTLGQGELVDRVRRSSGALSVRLGRLERARLIEREPDPDNRRRVTVRLTDRGRRLVEAARPAYADRARRLAEGLPPSEARGVADGLRRWLEFFEPDERSAPRLGVAVAPAAVAKRMRGAVGLPEEPGVLVMRVGEETPAARGGLRRGDLITGAGGRPVVSIGDLHRAVQAADGRLELSVLRGAEPHQVHLELPA